MSDTNVIPLFHAPRQPPSEFIAGSLGKENEEFAIEDLAKSGLTPANLLVDAHPLIRRRTDARAAYVIPYFGLDGKPLVNAEGEFLMWRARMKYPDFYRGNRYDQPSGEELAKSGLPPSIPYIHPKALCLPGDLIACAEREK